MDKENLSGKWLLKRAKRIFPLYWIGYFLALAIRGVLPTFQSLIVHILGIHGLFPQYHNEVVAEWYIGVIVLFYLIAPVIHKLVNSLERAWYFFLLSMMCATCSEKLLPIIFHNHDEYDYLAYDCNTSIWIQLPSLALGIILYYLIPVIYDKQQQYQRRKLLSITIIGSALVLLAGSILGKNVLFLVNTYAIFTLSFLGIAVACIMSDQILIVNPFFSFLGKMSYPIYVFHLSMISVLECFVHIDNLWYSVMLKVPVSIALSLGLYYVIHFAYSRLRMFIKDRKNTGVE